jgi:hypothetical protein
MRDSDLAKLRRARATMRIDQLEPQLAGYQAKLANLEACIQVRTNEIPSFNETIAALNLWLRERVCELARKDHPIREYGYEFLI